jgi:Trk-type K+ transport system membrane component
MGTRDSSIVKPRRQTAMQLKKSDLWFLAALLAVTALGAVLLARTGAVDADARHLSYARHHWQAVFDALSASCGVGLLTYGFQEDYTPLGRWILTGLGVAGALLFVAAVAHTARRMQPADALLRVPHPLLAVLVFVIVQLIAIMVFLIASGFDHLPENSWRTIAAFSSLGWGTEIEVGGVARGSACWPLALIAWIGALGWPVWLLVVPPLSERYVHVRSALAMMIGCTLTLLLAALLIAAFESPRGTVCSTQAAGPAPLSAEPWPGRYARSLVQAAAAAGAGMPTEPLAGRAVTDGTKATLCGLLLIGGLSGSATGGVQWTLLLWALAGGAASLGWHGGRKPGTGSSSGLATGLVRWMHAGLACLVLMVTLTLIVAAGLLLIENSAASSYEPPPTVADALLDASSVVAGGNLSSGLTEAVTGRNLISGMRQSANLYQYGMVWLMLAMLAGRVLPLVVLRRLADAQ